MDYKPWIDVRCFSSSGRMSRRPGVTTGRVHHLFSDNEDFFFLMADYAVTVLDIREQFPLLPEMSTQQIAKFLGVHHPKFPYSATPLVMTTDFLLTVVDQAGTPSLAAWSIKSVDELQGKGRKSVLAKLEIERRYWLRRGVPWHLFTSDEFNETFVNNLDWLSYFTVEHDVTAQDFARQLPQFLSAFEALSSQGLSLKDLLRECGAALGGMIDPEIVTDMFRYCVWRGHIDIDLNVPVHLNCIPSVRFVRKLEMASINQGGSDGASSIS